MPKDKISSFEQLIVWQKSAELAQAVYMITKSFPSSEKFSLTDQIQRSAVSVSANIAEGFGRSSISEKSHYYVIAYGSLLETKSHLLIANKIGYIDEANLSSALSLILDVQKLITASRKSIRNYAK